jgi:hypothetical protein
MNDYGFSFRYSESHICDGFAKRLAPVMRRISNVLGFPRKMRLT